MKQIFALEEKKINRRAERFIDHKILILGDAAAASPLGSALVTLSTALVAGRTTRWDRNLLDQQDDIIFSSLRADEKKIVVIASEQEKTERKI